MKAPFSKLLAGPLVVLALSSLAMAPLADAAGRGGGGGGGGARAGGGGARAAATAAKIGRAHV